MATRRINGTLDTFSVDSGSEITYVGGSTTGDKSDDVRGFEVNPGGTGNIIVNLEKTSGIRNVQIFQKDAFDGSSSPTGYQRFFDIEFPPSYYHVLQGHEQLLYHTKFVVLLDLEPATD